jgi:hypothetical protein
MARWSFQCRAPTGEDLCFNGGQCIIDPITTKQSCKCPDGAGGGDYDWFHFENCARPSYAPKVITAVSSVLYLPLLFYLCFLLLPTLRKDLRVLGWFQIVCCFALFVFGLSFTVDDGCREMCAVSSNAAFVSAAWVTTTLILIVMKPLYAVRMRSIKRFRKGLIAWTFLISFSCLGTGIAMAVLTSNPARIDEYNMAAYASTAILWIGGLVQLLSIILTSGRLRTEVQAMQRTQLQSTAQSRSKSEADKVIMRIRMLQAGSCIVLTPFVVLLISTPILFAVLGSFPFFYIVTYLEFAATMIFTLGVTYFLRNPPSKSPSSSYHVATVQATTDVDRQQASQNQALSSAPDRHSKNHQEGSRPQTVHSLAPASSEAADS